MKVKVGGGGGSFNMQCTFYKSSLLEMTKNKKRLGIHKTQHRIQIHEPPPFSIAEEMRKHKTA